MKCAVVGFGYWGPNWARTVSSSSVAELAAVVDISEQNRIKASSMFPDVKVCKSVDQISPLEIEIAVIATPPGTHYQLAVELIDVGVKTLIVEKPLATSISETEHFYAMAASRDVRVVVDYPYLYSDAIEFLGGPNLASSRVDYVESQRHNLGIFRPDMSVLWDLSVHDLSIFDKLFGPLEDIEVSCSTTNSLGSRHPSQALTQIRGQGFPRLVSSVSWISPAKVRRFVTHSPSQMVVWDDTNALEPIKVFETEVNPEISDLLSYRVGTSYSPRLKTSMPLDTLLHRVIKEGEDFDFEQDKLRTIRIASILEKAQESDVGGSQFISV